MSDTKQLGMLAIGLLTLMVVMGLVFIVGDQYLKTICENINGEEFQGGACYTDTNYNVSSENNAFNQTELVIDAIELVTAFLTIIVLVMIVKILVTNARSLEGGQ